MKWLLTAFLMLCIMLAGCAKDDSNDPIIPEDNDNPGLDSSLGVHIISPAPNANNLFEIQYVWTEDESPYYRCQWGYSVDTTISALVTANVPGGVFAASTFTRSDPYGSWYHYFTVYPEADTFLVPFFTSGFFTSYVPNDTLAGQFFFQITAGDQSLWVSQARSYRLSRVPFPVLQAAPLAPEADTLYEYAPYYGGTPYLSFEWCTPSPSVNWYILTYQTSFEEETVTDTLQSYNDNLQLYDYLPMTQYAFWIKAMNEYGVSASSDTLTVYTSSPHTPTDIWAAAQDSNIIHLSWNNHSHSDSLYLARKDVDGGLWATIHSFFDYYAPASYVDSTAMPHTAYYYRTGLNFRNGTWWSEDSVWVATP